MTKLFWIVLTATGILAAVGFPVRDLDDRVDAATLTTPVPTIASTKTPLRESAALGALAGSLYAAALVVDRRRRS